MCCQHRPARWDYQLHCSGSLYCSAAEIMNHRLWVICFLCTMLPQSLQGRCYWTKWCETCEEEYVHCTWRKMDTILQYLPCVICKSYCMKHCTMLDGWLDRKVNISVWIRTKWTTVETKHNVSVHYWNSQQLRNWWPSFDVNVKYSSFKGLDLHYHSYKRRSFLNVEAFFSEQI